MFSDQDDIWLSNKIEKTISNFLLFEEKYGKNTPLLIHADLIVVDKNLQTISNSFWDFVSFKASKVAISFSSIRDAAVSKDI